MIRVAVCLAIVVLADGLRLLPDKGLNAHRVQSDAPSELLPWRFWDMYRIEKENKKAGHHPKDIRWMGGAQFNDDTIDRSAPIKLVIGIPAPDLTALDDARKAHRSTWMSQDGVCDIKDHAREDCKVFPVFLQSSEGTRNDKDTTFQLTLPFRDEAKQTGYGLRNAGEWVKRDGKGGGGDRRNQDDCNDRVFGLFYTVRDDMPWATHVAKLDMDAYPHIPQILSDLSQAPRKKLYFGRSTQHLAKWRRKDKCVLFMQGSFMGISADSLDCVVEGWNEAHQSVMKWWDGENDDARLIGSLQTYCGLETKYSCVDVSLGGVTHPV